MDCNYSARGPNRQEDQSTSILADSESQSTSWQQPRTLRCPCAPSHSRHNVMSSSPLAVSAGGKTFGGFSGSELSLGRGLGGGRQPA